MSLFDSRGYTIRFEIKNTINLKQQGLGEDARDLGVFIKYVGAVTPEIENINYSNDKYCVSRLAFPYTEEWNPVALTGFHGIEPEGTWSSGKSQIHIKDIGIVKSGLKIIYKVEPFIAELNSGMQIYINDVLMKEVNFDQSGEFEIVFDVSQIGKETEEYLENAHRILKIILKEFDRVCQKYNLHYYLICGSLLGAVRHGDLIPWDDDVDVAMPRKDFDKLRKIAKSEWPQESGFQYVNYSEMGKSTFLDYMNRLVYMKEEIPVNIFRKIRGKGRTDIDNHLPIDIYVLDNASDNDTFHDIQTKAIQGLYGLCMGHRAYVKDSDYYNRDDDTQKLVKRLCSIGKVVPLKFTFGMYEWIRKWNKHKSGCKSYFESNGFIYCIPWKFKQEWFGEGTRLPLGDDLTVMAPKDYESFLKMHYSDFNQYPPMEVREPTHSVNASGIF